VVYIIEDKKVLKSDHLDSDFVQILFSLIVIVLGSFVSMHFTVKLHSEVLFDAIKIENVIPDTMLSPELASGQLRFLQCKPKRCFGRSKPSPRLSATRQKVFCVV
jgi:hypothetical protein